MRKRNGKVHSVWITRPIGDLAPAAAFDYSDPDANVAQYLGFSSGAEYREWVKSERRSLGPAGDSLDDFE